MKTNPVLVIEEAIEDCKYVVDRSNLEMPDVKFE
jgi:hypothetical protein